MSKRRTATTGCGHPQVMRHDYHTETWWQCEDCDLKFEPDMAKHDEDVRQAVRRRCALVVERRAGELRDLLKTIEESCGPGDVDAETERVRMQNRAEELELVAAAIRQLDLTTPSSTEEGRK